MGAGFVPLRLPKVRKVNRELEGTSCAGNSSFDKLADRR